MNINVNDGEIHVIVVYQNQYIDITNNVSITLRRPMYGWNDLDGRSFSGQIKEDENYSCSSVITSY